MEKNSNTVLVFADVQQDDPRYLCMDSNGLYLCGVRQQDGDFIEQGIQRVDAEGAMVFMAGVFNKAMKFVKNM